MHAYNRSTHTPWFKGVDVISALFQRDRVYKVHLRQTRHFQKLALSSIPHNMYDIFIRNNVTQDNPIKTRGLTSWFPKLFDDKNHWPKKCFVTNFDDPFFNDFAYIPWEDTPNFPKPPQRKEILHKLLVKHLGYLPGVCGWDLRFLSSNTNYLPTSKSYFNMQLPIPILKIPSQRWWKQNCDRRTLKKTKNNPSTKCFIKWHPPSNMWENTIHMFPTYFDLTASHPANPAPQVLQGGLQLSKFSKLSAWRKGQPWDIVLGRQVQQLLVGWLVNGWLVGLLVDVGWCWLILVDVGWLFGWLVVWLVGWLVG